MGLGLLRYMRFEADSFICPSIEHHGLRPVVPSKNEGDAHRSPHNPSRTNSQIFAWNPFPVCLPVLRSGYTAQFALNITFTQQNG